VCPVIRVLQNMVQTTWYVIVHLVLSINEIKCKYLYNAWNNLLLVNFNMHYTDYSTYFGSREMADDFIFFIL